MRLQPKFGHDDLGLQPKFGHGDLGLESKFGHGDLGLEPKIHLFSTDFTLILRYTITKHHSIILLIRTGGYLFVSLVRQLY